MSYNALPITERTKRIKEKYLKLPVPKETNPYIDKKYRKFCTGDRWMTLGYLRGWYNHSNAETTRLRTSYAEAEELYQSEPAIYDDELLVGHLYLPQYTAEEQAEYDKLCDSFKMSSHTLVERAPRKDHLSLDFDKLINLGINGIKKEIEKNMSVLNFNNVDIYPDYEVVKRHEFYRCCLIELDAVLDLAKRYSEQAKEMAEKAEPKRKAELLKIAKVLENVPANPAANFYEAIQSVQFFLGGLFGLYPLGRPDRYLYKFYKADIENGSLTKELAQELVDNFCLYISDRVFSRAACGFIVGGQDKDGKLVENDLTYMFLTALDHLRLPDPNGALAVCEKTSDEILEYATEILSHGISHPAFYNDSAIINSLINNYGATREDAVNYIHTTSAELSNIGKTRSHTTPFNIDLPRLLQNAAKENPNCKDYQEFEKLYLAKIKKSLQFNLVNYITRMMEASRIGNEAMRVCTLIDNCIERGKSIYDGGEKYTFVQPICVGFSTAVDSLVALEELVFNQNKLSIEEFKSIAENNYENNERLRQYIIHKIPHYGNDNETADKKAKRFANKILEIFNSDDIPMGKQMMPGTFTYINHATMGQTMGATFDGRISGYSYSDGCSPTQGRDTNGPTAMILSLTSWEQSKLLGGMVVNIKFGADHLKGDKKYNFIRLLRTFIERGGIEIQVNVVDRETLEDARNHPENHQNLLVRIGGYSDYFIRLTPTLQQEVIDRTEY